MSTPISTTSIFLGQDQSLRARLMGPSSDGRLYSIALGEWGSPATVVLHGTLEQLDHVLEQLWGQRVALRQQCAQEVGA